MANVLGQGTCLNCEATVDLAVSKNDRVYIYCNGTRSPDRKACGLRATFGATDSENMINAMRADDGDKSGTDGGESQEDETGTSQAGTSEAGSDDSGSGDAGTKQPAKRRQRVETHFD